MKAMDISQVRAVTSTELVRNLNAELLNGRKSDSFMNGYSVIEEASSGGPHYILLSLGSNNIQTNSWYVGKIAFDRGGYDAISYFKLFTVYASARYINNVAYIREEVEGRVTGNVTVLGIVLVKYKEQHYLALKFNSGLDCRILGCMELGNFTPILLKNPSQDFEEIKTIAGVSNSNPDTVPSNIQHQSVDSQQDEMGGGVS